MSQRIPNPKVETCAAGLLSCRNLRLFILAATLLAFWLYTFRFINVNSNPMDDGLEWMAVFPFGFAFFGFVVPALVIGTIGRLLWFGPLLAFWRNCS
jgi:hypothetical protein